MADKLSGAKRSKSNRQYKKAIYSLCRQVSKGDVTAASKLEIETKSNPMARWAVKHWRKVNRRRLVKYKPVPAKVSMEEQNLRAQIQRRGFSEGAAVPGSTVRKITK